MADHGGFQEQRNEQIIRHVRLTRIFAGTNLIDCQSLIED
jgi:hypothetical protein